MSTDFRGVPFREHGSSVVASVQAEINDLKSKIERLEREQLEAKKERRRLKTALENHGMLTMVRLGRCVHHFLLDKCITEKN